MIFKTRNKKVGSGASINLLEKREIGTGKKKRGEFNAAGEKPRKAKKGEGKIKEAELRTTNNASFTPPRGQALRPFASSGAQTPPQRR